MLNPVLSKYDAITLVDANAQHATIWGESPEDVAEELLLDLGFVEVPKMQIVWLREYCAEDAGHERYFMVTFETRTVLQVDAWLSCRPLGDGAPRLF